MRTTWPFGSYEYSPSLGYQIFGVPLVVPFAWIMMAHSVFIAARRVAPNLVFIVGGYGLMAWDLFLDPQMVSAGRWSWEISGRSVPFQPEIPRPGVAFLGGSALGALVIWYFISVKYGRRD